MKRILTFFLAGAAVAALTGCDPTTSYDYEVKNETQSDVTFKIGHHEQVVIAPGDKKIVFLAGVLGGSQLPLELPIGRGAKVTINDKLISTDFWKTEYWAERRNDEHHYTFLLILTDELLESLLPEEEQ